MKKTYSIVVGAAALLLMSEARATFDSAAPCHSKGRGTPVTLKVQITNGFNVHAWDVSAN